MNLAFRTALLSGTAAVVAFTPASLFASGEVGAWYDPSDMSTLWQDQAKTTPVTAVEQPVSYMADKSGRGNDAYTPSGATASRPVLSARVNLLTKTEQFDDAVWVKLNSTVTANTTVAPDGTTTADTLKANGVNAYDYVAQNYGLVSGNSYRVSYYLKQKDTLLVLLGVYFNPSNDDALVISWTNGIPATNSVSSRISNVEYMNVGDGWYKVSFTYTAATTGTFVISIHPDRNVTGKAIYAWGADLRVANDGVSIPTYQRVNTSTDYGTTNFPMYLRFDGSDDYMLTGTITPGTDKAQVFAGVRKLSDAALGVVAETTETIASNNGGFLLSAPNSAAANLNFSSKGTTQVDNVVTTYTAPTTRIVSGLGDISGSSNIIRVNGSQSGSSTSSQGTGNYSAAAMYIGRRNAASSPFNGRLYGLLVRFGANLTDTQITNTETWMNGKTKAY